MLEDPEASRILLQKPRINSKTVDLDRLSKLPKDTVGGTYYAFLEKNKVTPDSRSQVRFIQDPELAYVMQRYREIHDLVHAVSGQPTNMLGNT
jgi:ubiquinone biosynthesis protein COQ4